MTTTVVNIQIDANKPNAAKLKDNPTSGGAKGLAFGPGDALQLQIDTTSFPTGSVFQSVTFYPTSDESSNGASGTFAGRTNAMSVTGRRPSGDNVSMFVVNWATGDLSRPIIISDSEGVNANDCAWFAIVIAAPNGTRYTLDPELINTSGGGPVGWQPTRPPTLQSVALA